MKRCNMCFYCLLVDTGYSNYTVEGTEVHCLKEKHPDDGFDNWYGEDGKLLYAEKCPSYKEDNLTGPLHKYVDDEWEDIIGGNPGDLDSLLIKWIEINDYRGFERWQRKQNADT